MSALLARTGSTLVLDVSSSGQPHPIDWSAAPPEALAAIMRATEGQGSPDRMFTAHARDVAESGRMAGSYHVLEAHWPTVDEQALEYFEVARSLTMLCPILDVEETEASAHVELEVVAQRAASFVAASSRLWSAVGKPRGLLYTYVDYLARMCATPAGLAAMQSIVAAGWGLWLAAYRPAAPAPREGAPWRSIRGWQFRNDLEVNGVKVDASWFVGGVGDLAKLGAAP